MRFCSASARALLVLKQCFQISKCCRANDELEDDLDSDDEGEERPPRPIRFKPNALLHGKVDKDHAPLTPHFLRTYIRFAKEFRCRLGHKLPIP